MSPDQASAWRLDGRRAVITGGSSGIGLSLAHELAGLGADLVLVARDPERLEQARLSVSGQFPERQIDVRPADLARAEDRERLAEAIDGPVHVLVNNAGINIRKPVSELSLEEYERVQAVNLTACFDLCRRLLPRLRESAPACVVNNASVAGLTHLRTGAPYGVSKAGLIQLTRNLAVEWAADDIRVNAVAPWYIATPLANQVLSDPAYRESVLARTPMKRVGRVEECARAMAFLCLPAASYITGHCLSVDGGFSVYGF
ncbi:SDR family oxidoreductase [Wenzhouxiangellaceae bacterium CH-27]|uniref:SDR family oxidoreductase n=1 Tax=Elongatibacter sediminis TaxID=3119006 RepID=A0AAW9RHY3_9GAMM